MKAQHGQADAVLITGVYGSGKSAAAQEMAHLLEQRGASYALLDLDYLGWADSGDDGWPAWPALMLTNLRAVVANYRAAGVQLYVLAGAIRNQEERDGVEAALGMPLRVVRLAVALPQIEQRLATDPTAGRRDDLRTAAAWLAESVGVGIEDRTVSNDGAIRDVATEILEWLGWWALGEPVRGDGG